MNTCKTCKHWTPLGDDTSHVVDKLTYKYVYFPDKAHYAGGEYRRVDLGHEVRLCKHPKLAFCDPIEERNGFGVADGSEYMAELGTAEDFGCVRHEEA